MDIYLDHNVVVRLMKGREPIGETISRLKAKRARVLYSPAHIEEVAVIMRTNKDQGKAVTLVREHLDFIGSLTEDWEYLPALKAPICAVKENPLDCLKRVVEFTIKHLKPRSSLACL